MLYETERIKEPIVEPSLVQMTQKAIELLSVNKNGFGEKTNCQAPKFRNSQIPESPESQVRIPSHYITMIALRCTAFAFHCTRAC